MVGLAVVSLLALDLLDHVHAAAGAGEGGNRRLEVTFHGSGLAHLVFGHRCFIVQVEIVIPLPKSVLARLVGFAEILVGLQVLCWIS